MVLYPEILVLKTKNQENIKKYKFQNCVYLDDGLFDKPIDIENQKFFSFFDDRDTLYIDDRFRNFQKWTSHLNNTNKYSLRLEDVAAEISKTQYIKRFYISAFMWRCKMLILLFRHPFLVKGCSRATRERILWNIFYHKFSIKNVIRMMIKENLTSSIVHKYNNTKTIFIYFSATEDVVAQVKDKSCSTCHDYTHMIFDTIVSCHISNNWFQTLENSVEKYITIGPIFSDLITNLYSNKKAICDKLNINQNAKIISFFDHSVGYVGVMTVEEHRQFIDGMLMLARGNPSSYFFFKSKKDLSQLKIRVGEDVLRLINSIEKMPNCFFANEFDLNAYDVMRISDLVVSAPMSTVIFEALCGGVKTITFDPLSQYVNYDIVTNKFPNFNAINYDELDKLVNYWLYQCTNQDFDVFLSDHIKSNVDQNCCETSMIDRLKEFLYV
jgi:polysaccharide biosynthesis PFTS motif protein